MTPSNQLLCHHFSVQHDPTTSTPALPPNPPEPFPTRSLHSSFVFLRSCDDTPAMAPDGVKPESSIETRPIAPKPSRRERALPPQKIKMQNKQLLNSMRSSCQPEAHRISVHPRRKALLPQGLVLREINRENPMELPFITRTRFLSTSRQYLRPFLGFRFVESPPACLST